MNGVRRWEDAETSVLMHEMGHSIGILALYQNETGVYNEDYHYYCHGFLHDHSSVMTPLSAENCNANPIHYGKYWKLRDMDDYLVERD